ncbi:MAG: tetratricopeptide repeat protein [Planctomycetota bacterium]
MSSLAEFRPLALLALMLTFALAPSLVAQDEEESSGGIDWRDYEEEDGNVDPRYQRARDYHELGDFEEAFRVYDQILAERPADVPVLITYGHMHWKIGEYDKAIAKLEKACELDPKHIKAKQFLAQLYFHQGRRAKSKETYEKLLALDWIREDVRHSGLIGLGKIALLENDWFAARRHFRLLSKEGNRADSKTGKKGLEMITRMMKWGSFAKVEGKRIHCYFAPSVAKTMEPKERDAYVARIDSAIERAVGVLGIATPDPWPMYVFEDDTECGFYTQRKAAHGWDYSWWISYSAIHSKIPPEHTAMAQIVNRWCGSRPLSRVIVEGFCAYLAGVDGDLHGPAKTRKKEGRLSTLRECQLLLRQTDEDETLRCYDHGKSMVPWMIDTYGLDKFATMWKRFNITVNSPKYKIANTKGIDWEAAFSAAMTKGLGADLTTVENGWRTFLAQ